MTLPINYTYAFAVVTTPLLLLVSSLVLVVSGFIIGWGLSLFRIPSDLTPYRRKTEFLSREELHFFEQLKSAVGDHYRVFPKVRLASLIEPGPRWTNRMRHRIFAGLGVDQAEFVLCTPDKLDVVGVIELDGNRRDHAFRLGGVRQSYYEAALKTARIDLMRLEARNDYPPDILRQKVLSTFPPVTRPEQPVDHPAA